LNLGPSMIVSWFYFCVTRKSTLVHQIEMCIWFKGMYLLILSILWLSYPLKEWPFKNLGPFIFDILIILLWSTRGTPNVTCPPFLTFS
jgi:hypothetical protein